MEYVCYIIILIAAPIFVMLDLLKKDYKGSKKIIAIIWICACVGSVYYFSLNISEKNRFEEQIIIQETKLDSLDIYSKKADAKLDSIHQAIISLNITKFSDLPLSEVMGLLSEEYLGLKREIAKVEKKVERKTNLPKLYIDSKNIERTNNEVKLTIKLKPTNNLSLGIIEFYIVIIGVNNVKIISLDWSGTSLIRSTISKGVSADKKRARLKIESGSNREITLVLRLTNDAEIELYSKEVFERSRISTYK